MLHPPAVTCILGMSVRSFPKFMGKLAASSGAVGSHLRAGSWWAFNQEDPPIQRTKHSISVQYLPFSSSTQQNCQDRVGAHRFFSRGGG